MSSEQTIAASSTENPLSILTSESLIKFTKFYTLIEYIAGVLDKKGYKVSPSIIKTASSVFLDSFSKDIVCNSIGFFLNINVFHKEIKGADYSFLEENYLKIFNLPEQFQTFGLKDLIDPIFLSKKDGVLDVPPICVQKIFEGLIALARVSLAILKLTSIETALTTDLNETNIELLKNLDLDEAIQNWDTDT